MLDLYKLVILVGAGFFSGLLNTLASSGSAVTLPLLVFLGLPANVANGTNRVPLLLGRISSIIAFQRAKAIDWRYGLILCIPMAFGTMAGAGIAAIIDPKYIGWAITVAVTAALILIITNPKTLLKEHSEVGPKIKWWHLLLFFLAGVWGGFIVLDCATYNLLLLVMVVGYDLKEGNAIKALLGVTIAFVSVIIFIEAKDVNWFYGLTLSVGSVIGSWIGAVLAVKEWIKVWIYRLLIIVISLEIYNLIMKYFIDPNFNFASIFL